MSETDTAKFIAEATEFLRTHPMGEAEALLDKALSYIDSLEAEKRERYGKHVLLSQEAFDQLVAEKRAARAAGYNAGGGGGCEGV